MGQKIQKPLLIEKSEKQKVQGSLSTQNSARLFAISLISDNIKWFCKIPWLGQLLMFAISLREKIGS